ncbi:MAG TPA: Flp pilus assembly protein CpaB [Candidatus Dormibacteraeota bacterium]|nr:Flp pilus assembly protein CpaB [Candidatus Dormibacteraeota bacterium]
MKRSNRLVILVGVLLAALAFVGIVILLNSRGPGGTGETPTTVPVLVASEPIDIGEEVTPDKVTVSQVDPGSAVGTRLTDPSMVSGQRALFAIPQGSQVPGEAINIAPGSQCIACQLLPGEKAIAFQVDRVSGLDFLITAGDHVDIVLSQSVAPVQETQDSVSAREGNPDLTPRFEAVAGLGNVRTVKTILTDMRVLYVSATRNVPIANQATPSPGQEGQAPAPAQIDTVVIVVAGSDQDAELIKFAQNDVNELGTLTAILRRVADAEEGVPEEATTGITLDILIEQYAVPIPNIVVLEAP